MGQFNCFLEFIINTNFAIDQVGSEQPKNKEWVVYTSHCLATTSADELLQVTRKDAKILLCSYKYLWRILWWKENLN